jgi:hypothetical protein
MVGVLVKKLLRPWGLTVAVAVTGLVGAALPAGAATAASNPTVIANAEFAAVAAASPTDAWAVGYVYDPTTGIESNLAEHWNGKTWTRVLVPPPPEPPEAVFSGGLDAVAVHSTTDAWVIGGDNDGFVSQVAHWNGKRWSQVSFPAALKYDGSPYPYTLSSVSIVSADSVWAVGYGGPGPSAVIMHWNGKTWAQVRAPATNGYQYLLDATVISADDAWAAGYEEIPSSGYSPVALTLHWNGKKWAGTPAPAPVGEGDAEAINSVEGIAGVAGATASGIWAAGNFNQGFPYIIRWNGKKWASSPVPSELLTTTYPVVPDAVAVSSASSVWAAGTGNPYNAVHWNGKRWGMVSIDRDRLNVSGLASTSASSVWAVGFTSVQLQESSESISAIWHWNGKAWAQS